MIRKQYLLLFLIIANILIADSRPNIIFILADDLGYGDLSCYNPEAKGAAPNNTPIVTPNINSLATNGSRLTDFYSAAPICSPSRRAFLTARYPSRLGEWAEAYRGTDEGVIASEDPTIGVWLKEAGYATACYGKWNIGEVSGVSWPGAHGFDDWLIIDHNTGYFDHTNASPDANGQEMLFGTGGKRISNLKGQYLTDIWTDKALSFIERNQNNPFFLYLPVSIPHSPLQKPTDKDMIYNEGANPGTVEGREAYVSMVEYLDKKLGEIFESLEKKGLTKNTLIIFTSDNGGMLSGNCWPLKKSKQWLEEGGIRVPFLIQWPKNIPAGTINKQMSIMMDASVTILDAAGAQRFVPEDRILDGMSLLPVIKGNEVMHNDRSFGWRRRDWGWQGNYVRQEAYRSGEWKLLRSYKYLGNQTWGAEYEDEIFNLSKDIGETQNLAKSMPEKYMELTKAFDQWKQDTVNLDSEFLIGKRDQLGSPVDLPGENDPKILNFSKGNSKGEFKVMGNEDKIFDQRTENGVFSIRMATGMKHPTPLFYDERVVPTDKYTKALVKMKVTRIDDAVVQDARLMLRHELWNGDDLNIPVKADGQWHEYIMDVTQSKAWSQWTENGRIGIVLPVPKRGEIVVEIERVELLK
jgi:arylsulfatase A-like enzyme